MAEIVKRVMNKKTEVVVFSSTAIALYGYDQVSIAQQYSYHPSPTRV
jgi:hypothetical protein